MQYFSCFGHCRYGDQWRWAAFKQDGKTIYKPIPRDRDQAYTKFDGLLLGLFKSMAAEHLQSFGAGIKDINTFNFPSRHLDRRLANEVTQAQWMAQARDLQLLNEKYTVEQLQPVDMFPHTHHIECVAELKLLLAGQTE